MADPNDFQSDDIVFEDLHGVAEGSEDVEVDLDAEKKGVRRVPPKQSDDDDDDDFDDDDDWDDDDDDDDLDDDDPDDDDDDDEEDDEDTDDDGDDDYGERVRRRIQRERAVTARERQRAERAEREAADAKKRLRKLRRESQAEDVEALETQIKSRESDLKSAIEKGETDRQVEITSELTDLRARKIAAGYAADADDDDDVDDDPSGSADRDRGGSRQPSPQLERWMSNHRSWYRRRGFETQTMTANTIDQDMIQEGWNAETDGADYFKELDKRLKEEHPEVFKKRKRPGKREREQGRRNSQRGQGRRGNRRQRRSPVGGVNDRAGGDRSERDEARAGRVRLNERDFERMRDLGLDPNDQATLKEWAAEKRRSALEEES